MIVLENTPNLHDISNIKYQFSWSRGDAENSNMSEDIDIYYCTGANYRAFKINRGIIGDKTLDYRGDYAFLHNGYGIYFLYKIEKIPRGNRIHIYVGKAEDRLKAHGMDRLVEHVNNDEKAGRKYADKWDKAVYITIKEDKQYPEFTPGIIKALESTFISLFKGLEQRISLDGKKADVELICYNIKTNEQSNEPFNKYKTHIHAIIALLAHNGIKLLPDGYIKAFEAESIAEEMQTYRNEIDQFKKALDLVKADIEAEKAKNREMQSAEAKQAIITKNIIDRFKNAQEIYSSKSTVVINGRVYTASEIIRESKSDTVLTPDNTATDTIKLIPSSAFTADSKFLSFYSKDGAFVKALIDRVASDTSIKNGSDIPIKKLSHFFGNQLYIVAPTTECHNLTMQNIINHYIKVIQSLDPMWAFDTDNCALPKIVIIHNMETQVKSLEGKTFIKDRIEKEFGAVKFDVVIGNPPYNNDIYIDFVTLGDQLATKYTCMITPAKWQAKGGEKNEAFRKNIVPRMSNIVYYPNSKDVFDIDCQGGICYYLINKDKPDNKILHTYCQDQPYFSTKEAEDITNESLYILYNNDIRDIVRKLGEYKQLRCKNNGEDGKYNVAITNVYSEKSCTSKSGQAYVTISPYVTRNTIKKNADTSFLDSFGTEEEANSYISYLETKFVRFMFLLAKTSLHMQSEFSWRFVPDPGKFNHIFTDRELYDKYNLTPEEIAIIESVIKERK